MSDTSKRRISSIIESDLAQKMVLLAGPRQCGKTTLAKQILKDLGGVYLNWDILRDRRLIQAHQLPENKGLWVLDELHKYGRWKNFLKGLYDEHGQDHRILVTGSAKLDLFVKGGDSLQGRHFLHRLHPLTLSEVLQLPSINYLQNFKDLSVEVPSATVKSVLNELLQLGGFPEPFYSSSKRSAGRWRLGYGERLVQQDIRDITSIRNLELLELFFHRLSEVAGGVFSPTKFARDLEVSIDTINSWSRIFERFYGLFFVSPVNLAKIKTLKKDRKVYLWDWARVELPGALLENLVAMHLLRFCHWARDVEGVDLDLRYYRDVHGREVDFIISKKRKAWIAVEVKSSEQELDPNLRYYLERQNVEYAFQLHLKGSANYKHKSINGAVVRVMPVADFLLNLP